MSKKIKFLSMFAIISFVLYAYLDISTFEDRCLHEPHEFEESIPMECEKLVHKKAREGDARAMFRYAHYLEIIVEEELSKNNDEYSREGFAKTIAKHTSPHKDKYLYWVKVEAGNGNDYFIRQALSFCQAKMPTFDYQTVATIVDEVRRKRPSPDINDLARKLDRGELYPCSEN
jgi:hypothetical protein